MQIELQRPVLAPNQRTYVGGDVWVPHDSRYNRVRVHSAQYWLPGERSTLVPFTQFVTDDPLPFVAEEALLVGALRRVAQDPVVYSKADLDRVHNALRYLREKAYTR